VEQLYGNVLDWAKIGAGQLYAKVFNWAVNRLGEMYGKVLESDEKEWDSYTLRG
jgi:hypothetical protein